MEENGFVTITLGLSISEESKCFPPQEVRQSLPDRYIATRYGFELAENTPNAEASMEIDRKVLQISVAEHLIGKTFSTLKAPFGYWHDCLYELRADRFLKDFRKRLEAWKSENQDLLIEKVDELLCEYRKQIRKTLEKRFSIGFPGFAYSTAKFLIGTIPGTGPLVSGCEWLGEIGRKSVIEKTFFDSVSSGC